MIWSLGTFQLANPCLNSLQCHFVARNSKLTIVTLLFAHIYSSILVFHLGKKEE